MGKILENPILRGMYPDPSICVAEGKYYLVNSTFVYAPGIPIFESEDLIHWTQIGHVLESDDQLGLGNAPVSGGIFAPTIRYNNGMFYVVTTNATTGKNFYVSASKPEGPWSLPVVLDDADGIDPSLYFEGDRCYYIGQHHKADAQYYGDTIAWIQELDLTQGKLIGEKHELWDGASKHAIWPEGPHLYHMHNWYYLMIAEGGTSHEHSVTIARSREIFGPYESCKNNPVFTHRHLGKDYPIQNIGHADLLEKLDGSWCAVMLGTRMKDGKDPMGRETYLLPVIWEDDWPVFYPGEGKIPILEHTVTGDGRKKTIDWKEQLDLACVMLRKPLTKDEYQLEEGKLLLHCGKDTLKEDGNPSYIGCRLEEFNFDMKTQMEFAPEAGEEAGLVYFYNEENYIIFTVCENMGETAVRVTSVDKGEEHVMAWEKIEDSKADLKIEAKDYHADFYYNDRMIASGVNLEAMCTEETGGFVGCTIGVYATANGKASKNHAIFDSLYMSYPEN